MTDTGTPGEYEPARVFREALARLRATDDVLGYNDLPEFEQVIIGRRIAESRAKETNAAFLRNRRQPGDAQAPHLPAQAQAGRTR